MSKHLYKAIFRIAIQLFMVFGVIAGLFGLVLTWFSYNRLKRLANRSNTASGIAISLHLSPNKIGGIDLLLLNLSILLKYLPGTKGYKAQLKPDPNHSQKFQLPLLEVDGTLKFDHNDLERFQRAVQMNESLRSHENREGILKEAAENNLFLFALTAPLVIYILAQHECPIKPLGAVNTRNSFQFHDPTTCRDIEGLLRASQEGQLKYMATFGGDEHPGIRKKRGMEFDITIKIQKGERTILTQKLYNLQFLKSSVKPKFDQDKQDTKQENRIEEGQNEESVETMALPRLDVPSPRLWAASCGDYNPIHILPLAAILFGFPSVIAHGNHAVALAVECVYEHQQQFKKAKEILFGNKPFRLDVQFVKPMVLPATLHVAWQENKNGVSLVILRGDRPCVTGSCYHDVL